LSTPEGLIVVGASHRSASLATRDRLFVADGDLASFDAELARAGIAHAIVLSTCDRVEVQASHAAPDDAAPRSTTCWRGAAATRPRRRGRSIG
jgi:glutamyl-tRNA reductase